MFSYVPELRGGPFFTHSSILQSHNSCIFLFLDGFSLSQSIIISTVNDSIVTKFQHTGNFRSGERLFGQHRKESFLFNKQVSPKNTLLWNKISRLHQRKWFSKTLKLDEERFMVCTRKYFPWLCAGMDLD